MAGFLRKKVKPEQAKKPVAAPHPPQANGDNSTPLFAKFASSKQVQDAPRIVSSPMTLASARKDTAVPPHLHPRGPPTHVAMPPRRDGYSRNQPSPENVRGAFPTGYQSRTSVEDVASMQQNALRGTRAQVDQFERNARPRFPPDNHNNRAVFSGNIDQHSTMGGPPLLLPTKPGIMHEQTMMQPHPFNKPGSIQYGDRTLPHFHQQPTTQPNNNSPRMSSLLDKPLPAHNVPEPSRNSSTDDPLPSMQGEYAHLWSMIAGEDVQLPDFTEGSAANPTNTPEKFIAQPSSKTSHASNLRPVPDILSDASTSHKKPDTLITPDFTPQKSILPITSQPPFSTDHRPPPPSNRSSTRPDSHPDSRYTTRPTVNLEDKNPSPAHQQSYQSANHNGAPNIYNVGVPINVTFTTRHTCDAAKLRFYTAYDLTEPELGKIDEPNGTAIFNNAIAAAQGIDANRPGSFPSQPIQGILSAQRPTSHIMGANISAPDASGLHPQRLLKDPVLLAPNHNRAVPSPSNPPAAVPSPQQRMSVQYHSSAGVTSPPRTSTSVRMSTGKIAGKPLIFAAMAAVDENAPALAPVNPSLSVPPVVQHKGRPISTIQPLQPPFQLSPPAPAPVPPRRDSLVSYPQPPQTSNPPTQSHLRGQSPPTVYQLQQNPSMTRVTSFASQTGVIVPMTPPKAPHLHSHPLNGTPSSHFAEEQFGSPPGSSPARRPVKTPRPLTQSFMEQKVLPSAPIAPGKEGPIKIDDDTLGVSLDDPFAKVEGVKMLSPLTVSRPSSPTGTESTGKRGKPRDGKKENGEEAHSESGSVDPSRAGSAMPENSANPQPSLSPRPSNEELDGGSERVINEDLIMVAPPIIGGEEGGQDYLTPFLSDAKLLGSLLGFFTFYDWCMLLSISREIRFMIVQNPVLRETVLERFLKPVGYSRWNYNDQEPLSLSLQDLSDYMRGVSTPTHEYARIAALYNHSLFVHPSHRDQSLYDTVRQLAASCRAYTRVVLRLRAQAEKEAAIARSRGALRNGSRPSSRAPSPTFSHSNQSHASMQNSQHQSPPPRSTFQSPLVRLKRAPLLRVFVPSPDGDWLSDKSVLECEAECRRAGIMGLIRLGDVVWDVAVGDEGNVGRLIWDGSYLIDLDYSYSPVGDLPKYLPTLAFPPSYFHRVIRTGPASSNPIAHIDLRPWGEEIAANLQLLQDRVRTETPQGAFHNVVRWVHRSSFVIRPPARGQRSPNGAGNQAPPSAYSGPPRFPIPDTGLFVDPGWYGTLVVETEGTNESLADLQARCGPGAFPPRPTPVNGVKASDRDSKLVFRILRERSRPGEIWIRAVSAKERLL
ncbi:hypothetical protein H0H93_004392 [Arthromyces matolae]|nr:hypothetical protein H0H93_004392 [Arthromyces matolae]